MSVDDAIYQNSDSEVKHINVDRKERRQRKRQQRGSGDSVGSGGVSKNVRRWKMNDLLSTPPRLIRRIKNAVDAAAAGDQLNSGHRKLAASRSAGELSAAVQELAPFTKTTVVTAGERAEVRGGVSSQSSYSSHSFYPVDLSLQSLLSYSSLKCKINYTLGGW